MTKKIVLTMLMMTFGLAVTAFGLFKIEQIEYKNSILETLQKGDAPDEKKIEALKNGSAEDRMIAAHFYFKKKETSLLEEILTQIIIDRKTPKFYKIRAFYNLANLQVLKGLTNQDRSAFKNAIFYYQESLRLDPRFLSSKYNLERLIQENPEQQKPQQKEENEEKAGKKRQEERQNMPDINPPPISYLP